MPGATSRAHKQHGKHKHEEHNDKKKKQDNVNKGSKPSFRKAFREPMFEENTDPVADKKKHDEKLIQELSDCLEDCSQQRLRALHMSLRNYGNDESKISNKDLIQSVQENGVNIPSRLLRSLTAKFEFPVGIDLEGVHSFLADAHSKTGRDSVLAMHQRNDLIARPEVSQEEVDEDLMWRIESQLIKSRDYIDTAALRTEFQGRDVHRASQLEFDLIKQICTDQGMPVFGALLKNVLKRCSDKKNKHRVRWPEFLSFLEKAQENAWNSCPSLREIPEKAKTKAPVAPSPIDELSTRARNTLVNKLRKKSSVKKPPAEAVSETKQKTDENQNKFQPATEKEKHVKIEPENQTESDNKTNKEPEKETPKQNVEEEKSPAPDKTTTKLEEKKQDATYLEVPNDVKNEVENNISDDIKTRKGSAHSTDTKNEEKNEKHTDDNDDKKDTIEDKQPGTPVEIKVEQPPLEDKSGTNGDTVIEIDKEGETNIDKDKKTTDTSPEVLTTIDENDDVKLKEDAIEQEEKVEVPVKTMLKYEVTVRGRSVSFDVEEGFLDQQKIDPPAERMRLDWIYGYRGNDCRKNIHILNTGEIVYFISYIAIVYNRQTDKQRHYREHTDDIKCIDVHSNKLIVASGQYGSRKNNTIQAHVRVWRCDTLQTLHVLGAGKLERTVLCVAFAPGKDILAVVDNSLEKTLTVWDTNTGNKTVEQVLHSDLICDVGFNQKYPDTLVTIGKEHLCWWRVTSDSDVIEQLEKPDYDGFLKAKFVICMAFSDRGDLITGDSNGTIYIFGNGGHKVTNYVKHAHDGPVFTVLYHKGHVLSGGRDGIIHCWQWNRNMDSNGFLQLPKTDGGIRMLRVNEGLLLIGTTMNSILATNLSDGEEPLSGAQLETHPVTQCHYDDLRGLTTLPNSRADVLTAGIDGIVCGFNSASHDSVFKFQMKGHQYICVDMDESGTFMTLGTKDGRIQLMELLSGVWKQTLNVKLCKERLDCIKVSPDCKHVAAGSRDSCIYILSYVQKEHSRKMIWDFGAKLQGHKGGVHTLDWSSQKLGDEGYLMRSCSNTLELIHWLPASEEVYTKPVTLSADDWASHTTLLNPDTVGILLTKNAGNTDIFSIARNRKHTLACSGDNSGNVNLYRLPSSLNGVFCHSYKGHMTVHTVRFTPSGNHLMTVGGRDSCLMQWEVV